MKCNYRDGKCINCGKPKGWRLHTWNRKPGYQPCPGKKVAG